MFPNARVVSPVILMLAISAAHAHVTVQPRESTAFATQKYAMRVPK